MVKNEGRSGDQVIGGRKDEDQLYREASAHSGAGERTTKTSAGFGSELVPHPWRVSDDYADERIREKIGMYGSEKPRIGLENVSRDLREAGVPAAWRLHYITAVAHLGRVGAQTLPARVREAQQREE